MKFTVFGASGGTGLQLIDQTINKGHSVKAFVRAADRVPFTREGLTVVEGDVLNEEDVDSAVEGQDAVFVALGATAGSPSDICLRGTRSIVNAMRRHQVKRLVVLTGFGTSRESRKQLGIGMRMIVKLASLITFREFRDKERQDGIVRQSELDWTIVQPPRLTNEPGKGRYKHGVFSPSMLAKISRADVANFMIDSVEHARYIKQSSFIHD
ncbi:NAD(P)-dependent oxidoreductase [Cohnella cholangitidis]|uniref:SDR family oxidoreductase n=1 Tax=Cohnella cholangitidis TaxID=2598458 RepID=A0A7G5BYR3_9BACL|nr:SDR family oxidoreductase [Cohnella cholangitidis]QMV42097.1 SDR family oxidoreductase [Cohnella cholangitidis]